MDVLILNQAMEGHPKHIEWSFVLIDGVMKLFMDSDADSGVAIKAITWAFQQVEGVSVTVAPVSGINMEAALDPDRAGDEQTALIQRAIDAKMADVEKWLKMEAEGPDPSDLAQMAEEGPWIHQLLNKAVGCNVTEDDYEAWLNGAPEGDAFEFNDLVYQYLGDELYNAAHICARLDTVLLVKLGVNVEPAHESDLAKAMIADPAKYKSGF